MFGQIFIPALFGLALLIQFIYLLWVFPKLARHRDLPPTDNTTQPGVSILVAAWNELHNLKQLLPALDAQQYPDFEIVVIDDRSSDGTYDYLLLNEGHYKRVTYLRILDLPEHFTAKKFAVTMGIKKASKELIITVDADCLPQSEQWLATMVAQLTPDKDIVVGFSPYYSHKGALNALIRYETFQTAAQYMSFAKAGFPFMGVGRNLLYRKHLFWENQGFKTHAHLLSGDDDLFINEVAKSHNVAICTSPEAWTVSEPKRTWAAWYRQKMRHLSVGKKYRLRNQLTIGLLWMSHLAAWFLFIPTLLAGAAWFTPPQWAQIPNTWLQQHGWAHYYPFTNWMRLVVGLFVLWLLLRWAVLAAVNKRLGRTVAAGWLLVFDFLYAVYLLVFGVFATFADPQKIKWR